MCSDEEAGRRAAHGCTILRPLCAGLFRQAGVKKLADFLARDFRQPAARAAAAKNAFVLLGQHRYDLAAVFFVLSATLHHQCLQESRTANEELRTARLKGLRRTPQDRHKGSLTL